jgi:SAM-dependent methyltransferase
MKRSDVGRLYDTAYAGAYDGRFLLGADNAPNTAFELELIAGLLGDGEGWLDLGCGSGWFLAQFPGVARGGLDLSPAMVAQARARNRDALFVREGDFRDAVPEWEGAWSLVSCMWAPYSYLETIAEVGTLVANMAAWTAPGGAVLLPLLELPYLSGEAIPYVHEVEHFGGTVTVNGYVWSWDDRVGGKRHERMILPHAAQLAEWLAPKFAEVRVVRYPTGRRAIVATGRRLKSEGDAPPAQISWDPAPAGESSRARSLGDAPLRMLVAEMLRRIGDRAMGRGRR